MAIGAGEALSVLTDFQAAEVDGQVNEFVCLFVFLRIKNHDFILKTSFRLRDCATVLLSFRNTKHR